VPLAWPENYCFSNIVTVFAYGNDPFFFNNGVSNPFGFNNTLNYARNGTVSMPNTCLSPTMLDFYRNNLVTIGNLWNTLNFSPLKTITNYDLTPDAVFNSNGSWFQTHHVGITYATLTIKPGGGLGF